MSCATPLNPFKDPGLSDGAVRTFGLLCELDRGSRGCFAHRETLARLRRLSVSSINHQIAELKQRGYVTVTRKGQKSGESGIIRVSDIARNALLALLPNGANLQESARPNLQQVANLQESANELHVLEYCLNSTETTTDSGEGTERAEVKTDGAVVVSPDSVENLSEKPETNPNETVIHDLVDAGVDETHARQLVCAYPEARCRAAIAYVRDKGQGVKNSGGYIRFLLESNSSIPKRYFQQPERKKPSVPQPVSKPAPVPAQANPARLQRKTTSPHHQIWSSVCAGMQKKIQPRSYETWIEPLFIADQTEEAVVLDAPDPFFAEWVTEHYLWLIKTELETIGLANRKLSVTVAGKEIPCFGT